MSGRAVPAGEAARQLGISLTRSAGGIALVGSRRPATRRTATGRRGRDHSDPWRRERRLSARNRFRGIVREVRVDGLLAQVELDATGPPR